ncbi:MAG: SusF/SusE family outer membrane protein [Prevotella sp.]|nr:SusF/SusE family outer membrane protein [Prevotella sp.]
MKKLLAFMVLSVFALTANAEDHYLVGGCTPSGWSSGAWERSAVAMVNIAADEWIWTGKLTVADGDDGRFKIPNSAGGWDGYWAPEQDYLLTEEWADLSTSGDGDYKYRVAEEGIYKVTINTATLKIKAEKLAEPQKDGDFYVLTTVADYYWYAGYTTSVENTSKARLAADLDFAADGFFPLSCDRNKFKGEFDGAGHTLDGMTILGTNENVAFIRYASDGAYIHDLLIGLNSSFEGNAKIGGVIGYARDGGEVRLSKVINMATVRSTGNNNANAAGLVGCTDDGTRLTVADCANMGAVSGQDGQCGAFAGWTQSGTTFTNCWNCGNVQNLESNYNLYRNPGAVTATNCYDASGNDTFGQGNIVDPATIATGELCYKLNGNKSTDVVWYQKIGTEAFPTPFGTDVVYANGDLLCDGITEKEGSELSFSNTEGGNVDPHTFADGFCSVCNALDPDYMTPVDGFYEIATGQQLHWFANKVNQGKDKALNARLTANVDYYEYDNEMIGNGDEGEAYAGTFDGQGHSVYLSYSCEQQNVALFRYLKNATIRNLITDGTIRNEEKSCSGGIFAGSRGATVVENCVSYVSFRRNSGGDATIGGIGAYMHDNGIIRNCAFYGSVESPNAEGNGGLLGYANGGNDVRVENSVVNAATFEFSGNTVSVARNCGNVGNTYVVNCGNASQAEEIKATEEQLASGELCYLLNGSVSGGTSWYQLIDTDNAPLPFYKEGAEVYANGQLYCDGTANDEVGLSYSNENLGTQQDDHNFVNGVCDFCGAPDESYIALGEGGLYPLATASDVEWFAAMVNFGDAGIGAELTADIDFKGSAFDGIGSVNPFKGTFEGNNHVVSNLHIDLPNKTSVGFFHKVTGGAQIKGFTIDYTCSVNGDHFVGAFIGETTGSGNVTLERLGNEGSVESINQNAGGIVGCNPSGDLHIDLLNCYNAGSISSGWDAGGLSGWLGNDANTTNCYNMGAVSGGESFARGNNIQITNCFDPVTNWPALPSSPIEDFTNGTVYALLAEAAPGVWYLSAEVDGHPVLYETQWTATGICDAVRTSVSAAAVYNLSGQRVLTPKHGLYIVNGRKVVK